MNNLIILYLYKEEISKELSLNLGIDSKEIYVKKIINNHRFRTIRAIVNFSKEITKKIIDEGFVKIGYVACPVERSCNPNQCRYCYKYGHFHYDKDGETKTCRAEKPTCPKCTGDHTIDKCDKTETKCVNCGEQHRATYSKCKKRLEEINRLLNLCNC
jgi:hypothetical protein